MALHRSTRDMIRRLGRVVSYHRRAPKVCPTTTRLLQPQATEQQQQPSRFFNRYASLETTSHANRVFVPAEEFQRDKEKPFDKNENAPVNVEDLLFDMFKDSEDTVCVGKFLNALFTTGLWKNDPRLKEMMQNLRNVHKEKSPVRSLESLALNREIFAQVIRENIVLITRALRHQFVIPDFQDFIRYVEDFYWKCKVNTGGKPEMRTSEKFDWMLQYYKAVSGGEYLGFNNAIFLSEREAADRNYAIGFYMKENKCFPERVNLKETMDFYFQLCSLEVNCQSVSVMASTLANGGICPVTGHQIMNGVSCRDVLSLMHSCGMYDYSGQYAFKVGLPAKSGVSGCTMVVVPNVMGICLWSPPLDVYGNSVRGVQFCEELTRVFSFHHYDNLRHMTQKKDPRRQKYETKGLKVVNLLFSAASGDVTAMRRQVSFNHSLSYHYLSGMDMGLSDYDGRTALHLAAAEGHLECVEFLLKICGVDANVKDRWGHTPLDDARQFGHAAVADYLAKWEAPSKCATAASIANPQPQPPSPQNDVDSSDTPPSAPKAAAADGTSRPVNIPILRK
ncbi:hypothetical protein HPB50_001237 [Hyalomma asiaticum]|uniref:Uncharacterized protein n=1 Tax=Hyalomma asiaticum TaxID=266040 RepID=A0ACB7S034_HYAAI|nr:hypothetical protein HPB50_001237 [Hyalomma asiaticum]